MTFSQRPVDLSTDHDLLLEFRCEGNYESDSPWARRVSLQEYRRKWLSTPQPDEFLRSLAASLADPRTIAEIWEEGGDAVGFLWVVFGEFGGYDLTFAEVRDIEVIELRRRRGIGTQMLERAERVAREAGAAVLRSETGIENLASQALHEQAGFANYHIMYEKVLSEGLAAGDA